MFDFEDSVCKGKLHSAALYAFSLFFCTYHVYCKRRQTTLQHFYCAIERGYAMASCLSVCDVEVSWSHRLEFLENNFRAD